MKRITVVFTLCLFFLLSSMSASGVTSLSPAPGRLLIASDQIRDERFHHAVILLLRHDAHGSVGLILNKPTDFTIDSLLPENEKKGAGTTPIYSGGPLNPSTISVLWGGMSPPSGSADIIPGLAISGVEEMLLGLAMDELGAYSYRVLSGYCGWAPGQLEHELRRRDWQVRGSGKLPLLEIDPGQMWRRLRLESGGTLI
ncbi:MAG: hypothetical protein C0616_14285 [Desulfuromonas sp.]|nr:MAG: hypothetical protein C0616_14285 [Desulfuromonas sp.]